jgi:hypothetical protein
MASVLRYSHQRKQIIIDEETEWSEPEDLFNAIQKLPPKPSCGKQFN